MSQIKYRLYDTANRRMLCWNEIKHFSFSFINASIERNYYTQCMKWTGLRDKYGSEIYEKDILKVNNNFIVVSFGEYCMFDGKAEMLYSVIGFYSEDQNGWIVPLEVTTEAVVVGNIYENPYLYNPHYENNQGSFL